jgi:two-component system, OmpR family, phosphate regulon sensor histidine kinase PhoR
VERRQTNRVTWTAAGLEKSLARGLSERLSALIRASSGRWGWLFESSVRDVELLICSGKVKPHRSRWPVKLPSKTSSLSSEQAKELSPYHKNVKDFGPLRFIKIESGGLILEASRDPSPALLRDLETHLQLIKARREASDLRRKVQRLSQELKDSRQISARLKPALEQGERRTEALSKWYRQASEMLTSTHLRSRLPRLAQQAQHLLEADVSAILVNEAGRVRVWGSGPWRENVENSYPVEQLGALGRKVLSGGQVYRYQRSGKRQDKFLDSLGLSSALAIPLEIEGRVLGAVLFGHRGLHRFTADEMDLARLTAYQSALFLENTLLVTGSDVERVVARAVLESMADGVFTLDWEKKITSFNPAAEQITGWRSEDAIGRTCSEVMRARYLCPGVDEPGGCAENCPLLALIADQELMKSGLTVEGHAVHKSGEPRYVSSTYSVVADKGDLLGAVVLFRDITEKKRLEEMKSDYAAALSHDLKTPLTAMKGYAVTLLRHGDRLDDESRKEALEVINFEIDRVSRMFDNLLHQARLEAGVKNVYFTSVSPMEVIRQVVSLYAFSGRAHKIEPDVQPFDIVFRTDRDQLDQILNNLVSNALKYTPDGSRVDVRCRWGPDKTTVIFEVEDNGPGISDSDLPYVFQRFHRLGGASSKRVRGTGLGLHITRMLVESLGGETGVDSVIGQGSRFWFSLPKFPPEQTEED